MTNGSGFNIADIWLGQNAVNAQPGNVELRGFDTIRLIMARPSWIVISRFVPPNQTIQLQPQLVRIEIIENPRGDSEKRDAMVSVSRQYVELIGVKDNPYMVDTDLKRADQFMYQGLMYEITEFINTVPGRLFASGAVTP